MDAFAVLGEVLKDYEEFVRSFLKIKDPEIHQRPSASIRRRRPHGAVPQSPAAGRVLPLRESERLLLHFRILRPQLDADTLALNAVAIRRLAAAMAAATARRDR